MDKNSQDESQDRLKPLSLAPLTPEEALGAFMQVPSPKEQVPSPKEQGESEADQKSKGKPAKKKLDTWFVNYIIPTDDTEAGTAGCRRGKPRKDRGIICDECAAKYIEQMFEPSITHIDAFDDRGIIVGHARYEFITELRPWCVTWGRGENRQELRTRTEAEAKALLYKAGAVSFHESDGGK